MRWSTLLVAVSSILAVSAQSPPSKIKPGHAPSNTTQAEGRRVKINPDTACKDAEDPKKERNVRLAAWMECQVLGFYPYPRGNDANNTDWTVTFDKVMHPTLRASFNGTKYDREGFRNLFLLFSNLIGKQYAPGDFHPWREYYVASPFPTEGSKGGLITATGYNGGLIKGKEEPFYSPNGAFWTVEDIGGRRWITEQREQSTLPTPNQLTPGGSWDNCANQELKTEL